MNCPACGTAIQAGARFCGVCGHRIESAAPAPGVATTRPPVAAPRPGNPLGPPPAAPPRPAAPSLAPASTLAGAAGKGKPLGAAAAPPRPAPMPVMSSLGDDDLYLGMVLNNRFRVESKLGEGGFGAVYRGIQIATNRQVALKLLHPEMTRDENLVARFRREGLVLCNLKDAHTITTYDFDSTPDGTLYIAMELLQGRSLHDIFHDEAPLAWARMFKVVSEMCSSLAEAHATGIVHRDLKPENIYLENRPGNPEFVKVLDFGIAKVMRGDGSVDPHAPQLTATGQTLGTLEYMSPEQLMGKQLDGRSDVYALGVLAYEMITGRLPFPDAKGPAGLITAQLKQTPPPPSAAFPAGGIPTGVDRVILKMLEKDKNSRFADVSAVREAVLEVLQSGGQWNGAGAGRAASVGPSAASTTSMSSRPGSSGGAGAGAPMATPLPRAPQPAAPQVAAPQALVGGRPVMGPPAAAPSPPSGPNTPPAVTNAPMSMHMPPPMGPPPPAGGRGSPVPGGPSMAPAPQQSRPPTNHPHGHAPLALPAPAYPTPPAGAPPRHAEGQLATAASTQAALHASRSRTWVWVVVGFLVLGAVVGAILAFAA